MNIQAIVYTAEGPVQCKNLEEALSTQGETWVHVDDVESIEKTTLREHFDIHELALEDVLNPQTRPKTEEYDTHTFVLMKTAKLSQDEDVEFRTEVRTHPIGFFLGTDWLLTVATSETDVVNPTASQWMKNDSRVKSRGTDFLAYQIMDAMVDGYFDVLDDVEDDIESVEESVLEQPDPRMLEELNNVRRDLLAFRKVAWPAREALSTLSRGDIPEIAEQNEKYFRDVYSHLVQVVDLIETYRDLSGGSRDIYLNAVSQSTNEVMKTLTVVATIFIPLTFVVGVYGMNFTDSPFAMPELSWTYGYPATMLGMGVLAGLMLVYFRGQDWI